MSMHTYIFSKLLSLILFSAGTEDIVFCYACVCYIRRYIHGLPAAEGSVVFNNHYIIIIKQSCSPRLTAYVCLPVCDNLKSTERITMRVIPIDRVIHEKDLGFGKDCQGFV